MNLKKNLLVGALAVIAAGMTSCNKSSETTVTSTSYIPAYNLYTHADGSAGAAIGLANYGFVITLPANEVVMSADKMSAPGSAPISFTTPTLPITIKYLSTDNALREIATFAAPDATGTDSQATVTDLNVMLTQAVHRPPTGLNIPGYNILVPSSAVSHFAVIQYVLNGAWNVRTFWPDVTFAGGAMVTGAGSPYSDTTALYRIKMSLASETDGAYTADMIIYNFKGSDAEDAEANTYVLKGLPLKFNENGYTVKGDPTAIQMMTKVGEGSSAGYELKDTDTFPVKNFDMVCEGKDLTVANIRFNLGDEKSVTFTGSYIIRSK